ncbi:MAG: hypothetical protein IPK83_22170 [Planctomycetes bacterium]|nr:hypothetical protein [Planctomycetota bacterium]
MFGGGSVGGSSPISLNALTLAGQGTGFMIEGERGICPTCPGPSHDKLNGDLSGWQVDGARDLNDDGLADILVSAKNYGDDDQGRAYAVFGKANGQSVSLASIGGATGPGLLFDMTSLTAGLEYGYRMHSVGDYNADGRTDFMVVPGQGHTWTFIARSLGTAGTIALQPQNVVPNVTVVRGGDFYCEYGVDEETGEPLANGCTGLLSAGLPTHGGGDFDGDGRADLVRVVTNFDANVYEILVFFNSSADYFGYGGVFGIPEAPNAIPNGGVRIYSTTIDPTSWKSEITLNSDVNGDGYDDVVYGDGNGGFSGQRSTYVIFGGPGSRTINLDTVGGRQRRQDHRRREWHAAGLRGGHVG